MLLLDQFKFELLYYVSLLSNYSVIELMFFEEPLPCQNENWGYNFSSTFQQNECKYFHYIFFSFSRLFGSYSNTNRCYNKKVCWWRKSQVTLFTSLHRFRTKPRIISIYQQILLLYFSFGVWEINFILITTRSSPICIFFHLNQTKR